MRRNTITFLIIFLVLLLASFSHAAGTCVQSVETIKTTIHQKTTQTLPTSQVTEADVESDSQHVLRFTCTGDAADGTMPATAISAANLATIKGAYLYLMVTDPGTVTPKQPTAAWDLTFKDFRGADKMGGNGADLSATAPSERMPLISTGVGFAKPIKDPWTLAITGQSVPLAVIDIEFWFVR